jgi:filamin
MVQCTGRGLQQNGIRVGERVFIRICTKTSGEGSLIVTITGPNHLPVPLQTKKISTGLCEYSYAPSLPGRHVVEIMFGERPVISSPFTVNVGLPWDSKIRAFGPGLSGGAVGYSADFNVNMAGEPGMLGQ